MNKPDVPNNTLGIAANPTAHHSIHPRKKATRGRACQWRYILYYGVSPSNLRRQRAGQAVAPQTKVPQSAAAREERVGKHPGEAVLLQVEGLQVGAVRDCWWNRTWEQK